MPSSLAMRRLFSPIDPHLLLCFTSKAIPKLIVVWHSSETLSQRQTHSKHTPPPSSCNDNPSCSCLWPRCPRPSTPALKWSAPLWPACPSLGTVSLSLTLELIVWWLIHVLEEGKVVPLTCLRLSLRVCSKKRDERERRNIKPAAKHRRICFENVTYKRNGQLTVNKDFQVRGEAWIYLITYSFLDSSLVPDR